MGFVSAPLASPDLERCGRGFFAPGIPRRLGARRGEVLVPKLGGLT
jgi:hypothetical protein